MCSKFSKYRNSFEHKRKKGKESTISGQTTSLTAGKLGKHVIDTGDAAPITNPIYRQGPAMDAIIGETIKNI